MAESIAKQVTKFLKDNPDISNQELYEKYPDVRKNTLRHYKSKFGASSSTDSKIKSSHRKTPVPEKAAPLVAKKVASKLKVAVQKTKDEAQALQIKGKGPTLKIMSEKSVRTVEKFLIRNPKATYERLFGEFPTETKTNLKMLKQAFKKKIIEKANSMKAKRTFTVQVEVPTAEVQIEVPSKEVQVKALPLEGTQVTGMSAQPDLEARVEELESQLQTLMQALRQANRPVPKVTPVKKAGIDKIKDLEDNLLSFIKEKREKVTGELKSLEELQKVVTEKISSFISNLTTKQDD